MLASWRLATVPLLLTLACGGGGASGSGARTSASAKSGDEAGPGPGASEAEGSDEENDSVASTGAEDESTASLPSECAGSDDLCTPPKDFIQRLCQGVYPNVALFLFRGGTPWSRAYLTRKTEAWNASGGASVAGHLEFDEEVLILLHRGQNAGGMQVSGTGGGYEALRWNGACVTLAAEEVTLRRPPSPKYPRIEWKWVEPDMREALKEDERVQDAFIAFRKECKGVTMGTVSRACVRADERLSRSVIDYVTTGGELPVPVKLPD
jgi:hypothetical protein